MGADNEPGQKEAIQNSNLTIEASTWKKDSFDLFDYENSERLN